LLPATQASSFARRALIQFQIQFFNPHLPFLFVDLGWFSHGRFGELRLVVTVDFVKLVDRRDN